MKDRFSKVAFWATFFLLVWVMIGSQGCKNSGEKPSAKQVVAEPDTLEPADTVWSLEELNAEIRENPLNPELFVQRSGFHALNKDFSKALDDIGLALKLDSLNYEYYIMQAEYYIYNGQPNSAKKCLNDCLNLFPNNTEVMLKLAEIHFYMQEYSQAQLILRNVTLLNEDLAQIYFLNGLIFLENKDTTNAIRNLQLSVEKDPDFYAAFMELGSVHAKKGDLTAETYFRSALDIDPNSYEARYNLALFLQNVEKIEEAELEYEYIIQSIDSTLSTPYYNLGYINLIYRADFEKAESYFTEAIIRDSSYVEAWYNRGFSNEVMGNLKKAREDYNQSLKLDNNYPLSIKALNRLDSGQPFKF